MGKLFFLKPGILNSLAGRFMEAAPKQRFGEFGVVKKGFSAILTQN